MGSGLRASTCLLRPQGIAEGLGCGRCSRRSAGCRDGPFPSRLSVPRDQPQPRGGCQRAACTSRGTRRGLCWVRAAAHPPPHRARLAQSSGAGGAGRALPGRFGRHRQCGMRWKCQQALLCTFLPTLHRTGQRGPAAPGDALCRSGGCRSPRGARRQRVGGSRGLCASCAAGSGGMSWCLG